MRRSLLDRGKSSPKAFGPRQQTQGDITERPLRFTKSQHLFSGRVELLSHLLKEASAKLRRTACMDEQRVKR